MTFHATICHEGGLLQPVRVDGNIYGCHVCCKRGSYASMCRPMNGRLLSTMDTKSTSPQSTVFLQPATQPVFTARPQSTVFLQPAIQSSLQGPSPPSSSSQPHSQSSLQGPSPPSSSSQPHSQSSLQGTSPPSSNSQPHSQSSLQGPSPPSSNSQPHSQSSLQGPSPPSSNSQPHSQSSLQGPSPPSSNSPCSDFLTTSSGLPFLSLNEILHKGYILGNGQKELGTILRSFLDKPLGMTSLYDNVDLAMSVEEPDPKALRMEEEDQ
ncbi:unnamed protein product [Boreogadus saida]